MSEWQKIKTAPKDGTRMLGCGEEYGKPKIAITSWDGSFWADESSVTDDGYGWSGHDNWEPTHWMPLPDPPD